MLRRLAAMAYEALLAAAILFVGAAIATALAHGTVEGTGRIAMQAFLWALLGAYFLLSWRRDGRTLAMKAWHLRLVNGDGGPLTLRRAVARYVIASAIVGAAVVGAISLHRTGPSLGAWLAAVPAIASLVYGFFDAQGRFFHDRVSGTKIVHEKTLRA